MTPRDVEPVIFVSRKGTASESIDADPAYSSIYRSRLERKKSWWRVVARVVAVVFAVGMFFLVRAAAHRIWMA
jgi:hypothetical protein